MAGVKILQKALDERGLHGKIYAPCPQTIPDAKIYKCFYNCRKYAEEHPEYEVVTGWRIIVMCKSLNYGCNSFAFEYYAFLRHTASNTFVDVTPEPEGLTKKFFVEDPVITWSKRSFLRMACGSLAHPTIKPYTTCDECRALVARIPRKQHERPRDDCIALMNENEMWVRYSKTILSGNHLFN